MCGFDASSIIHAWDNYPSNQFPGLWSWIAGEVKNGKIVMSSVAIGEVSKRMPDCADWLRAEGIRCLEVDDDILNDAVRIKSLLGIVDDKYGSGVGENDILIIATARKHQTRLVSDESVQVNPPGKLMNSRIPRVCRMAQVDVNCISFIEYIKNSSQIF